MSESSKKHKGEGHFEVTPVFWTGATATSLFMALLELQMS